MIINVRFSILIKDRFCPSVLNERICLQSLEFSSRYVAEPSESVSVLIAKSLRGNSNNPTEQSVQFQETGEKTHG